MPVNAEPLNSSRTLTPTDLLAGSQTIHDVVVPRAILAPSVAAIETVETDETGAGCVRVRPLNIATLTLISRAARDNPGLVPLLTIKEALVEPRLTLDQIQQLHVGLVYFLVTRINLLSGLGADGETHADAADSSYGRMHVVLAKHFGWTPEQVSQLTPGQVAVYLAGIEKLLASETVAP